MKALLIGASAAIVLLLAVFAGVELAEEQNEGTAEEIGEAVDDAASDTADAVDEAAGDASRAVEDAAD